jgi:hypothetical protein
MAKRFWKSLYIVVGFAFILSSISLDIAGAQSQPVFPGETWDVKTPEEVGLDSEKLSQMESYLEGWGALIRHGYLVYSWGEISSRVDIASAAKPFYSHFLFNAIEKGQLSGYGEKVSLFEPCLNSINATLGYKDQEITFGQMANQISAYGVAEEPGTAYNYNDFQMALFWDTLFTKVYGASYETVDDAVFDAYLNDILQMEDDPTMLAFGLKNKPGRVAISVRDHARFGLLYLRKGNWNGFQVIGQNYVELATTNPVANTIPRTDAIESEMCPGQRSIGSSIIPDDHNDHKGSYSWLWWVNGVDQFGNRMWPDGPFDAFAALGHENRRGLAVIPSLDIVLAWNETTLDQKPQEPHPLNEALKLIKESVLFSPEIPITKPDPSLEYIYLSLMYNKKVFINP